MSTESTDMSTVDKAITAGALDGPARRRRGPPMAVIGR